MSTVAYVSLEEGEVPIIFSQNENPCYHKVQRLKLRTVQQTYLEKYNPALAFFRVRRSKRNVVAVWKCEDVVQIKSVFLFLSRSCSHCCWVWQRISGDESTPRPTQNHWQTFTRFSACRQARIVDPSLHSAYCQCAFIQQDCTSLYKW